MCIPLTLFEIFQYSGFVLMYTVFHCIEVISISQTYKLKTQILNIYICCLHLYIFFLLSAQYNIFRACKIHISLNYWGLYSLNSSIQKFSSVALNSNFGIATCIYISHAIARFNLHSESIENQNWASPTDTLILHALVLCAASSKGKRLYSHTLNAADKIYK